MRLLGRLRAGLLYVVAAALVVISIRWVAQQFDKSELYSSLSPDVLAERFQAEPLWEGRSDWQMCRSLGRPDTILPAERCDVVLLIPPRAYVKVYFYDAINLAAYIDKSGTVVATGEPVIKNARF